MAVKFVLSVENFDHKISNARYIYVRDAHLTHQIELRALQIRSELTDLVPLRKHDIIMRVDVCAKQIKVKINIFLARKHVH